MSMRQKTVPYIIVLLFGILPYINSIKNPFMWDDLDLIFNDPNIKDIRNIPKFFTTHYWKYEFPSRKNTYRPLRAITFAIDYAIWKKNASGYHLTNFLLNTVSVLLVFIFAKLISNSILFGIVCAAIFATLPVHVEAISWVKNRSEILCFIFFISSLIFFIKHEKHEYKMNKNSISQFLNLLISIFCFALALMSKENAVMMPFVILLVCLYERYINLERLQNMEGGQYRIVINSKKMMTVIPYFLILLLYLLYNFLNFISEIGISCSLSVFSKDALIVPATISEYVKILLWPFPLNPERFIEVPKLLSAEIGICLVFLILTSILLREDITSTTKKYGYGFALAFILIALIPVSNIVFFEGRPVAEQRLYLPSFGFAYLLALIITMSLRHDARVGKYFCYAIVSFNLLITFGRNFDWKNPTVFWEKTVQASPFVGRAQANLAMTYRSEGKYEKAIEILTDVCKKAPFYYQAFYSLGCCAQDVGLYELAIDSYKRALAIYPQHHPSLNNLAVLYGKTKQYELGIQTYELGLKNFPDSPQLHYNLGATYEEMGKDDLAVKEYEISAKYAADKGLHYNAIGAFYEKRGEIKKAVEFYNKAIKYGDDLPVALYNLGLLLSKLNKYNEALELFLRVHKVLPDHTDTLNNISIIYDIRGEKEKAIAFLNKAIEINPNDPKAYYNRAYMYIKSGNIQLAKNDFRKVLELEPKNKNAQIELTKIGK
ncbi:MAG: tetratricopeptide repeat protein [Elusimicrobiota bacterium]